MRASAAAANVISNEQPCRVKLRIWRYSPSEDVPGTSGALKGKSKDKSTSGKHLPTGAPVLCLMQCARHWPMPTESMPVGIVRVRSVG